MTSPLGFLDNGGEMGERIAALDWSEHPLGPAEQWPVSLKIAVNLCLHSSFPSAVYWGAGFHVIYNDAWAVTFPERHPGALGRPGGEVGYDSWEIIGPQLEAVLRTGKGLSATDEHVPMMRGGEVVDSWWTYSLSPICDETGTALGVLSQGNDTTIRAQAERSLRASEERLQMALDASGDVGTWEWDLINDVVVGDDRMARL